MAVQQEGERYQCAICGNIIQVLEVGGGTLSCCGQEMDLVPETIE